MELADTEVSDLANFMGHAEKIHKEIYRQPVVSRDILNITQHLEAAHGCGSQNTEESFSEDSNNDEEEINEIMSSKGITYYFVDYIGKVNSVSHKRWFNVIT